MSKHKGVPCPNCDSRNTEVNGTITCDHGVKRYRKCATCDATFQTYEVSSQTLDRKTAMITRGIGELRAYLDGFSDMITLAPESADAPRQAVHGKDGGA